jgi:hypothetical protein
MTKIELKEMIRECLREELSKVNLEEAAFSGGVAGDNSFSGGTVRGRGASTQPDKKSYLNRLKSKNPDLVDIMTIKGKDIKPGMITQAGQVKEAEVRKNNKGETKVYIMHTNNYDGFWDVDEDMPVMVDLDDKSKPFTGDYKDLLKMGLQEAFEEEDTLVESSLSAEEKVDAWHNGTRRENYKAAGIPKLQTFLDIAKRKGYSEIVDIIEAELAKRGVATTSATSTIPWEDLIEKADELLDELCIESDNIFWDDSDGYWSAEIGYKWTMRNIYHTDTLNNVDILKRLCDEYSKKLPSVRFYYCEDDPVSEIGYEATNVDYEDA